MKKIRFATVAGLALLLASCVSPQTTLTSTFDKSHDKEPKRVMVVETIGDELGQYHESFKATLAQRLRECGAAVDFITKVPPNPLALDNSAALAQEQKEKAELQAFSADAVLAIVQTGVGRTESIPPIVRLILYRLQFKDAESGKIFWQGDVRLFTAFDLVTVHDAGAAFANDLAKKLAQDGVFHSCAVANRS